MKIAKLLFSLLLCYTISTAQVAVTSTEALSGIVIYRTLKSAFDAINAGSHKGIITVMITGLTVETSSCTLNASEIGKASYTGVKIIPAPGIAAVISGNIDSPLINLSGSDNVIIDGLNSNGSSLTISNTSTSNTNEISTIRFIDDASNDSIRNSTILGSGTNISSGTIFFSYSSIAQVKGNDNNYITSCNIGNAGLNYPVNAIYSSGNATNGQENSSITIFSNNIFNFFNPNLSTAGILLSTGNTNWTISGNRIYQTAERTFATGNIHRAIQVTTGSNYRIINNIIGYASPAATGTYTIAGNVPSSFIAIDLNVGEFNTSVQNNQITNFSFSSTEGYWYAINIVGGSVDIGTETGNIIGDTTGTGSITVAKNSTNTSITAIRTSSVGTANIKNNSIGSINLLSSNGSLMGISTDGSTGSVNIGNNNIGNSTANNLRVGTEGVSGSGYIVGILNNNYGDISVTSNTIRNLSNYQNLGLSLSRGIAFQQGSNVNISRNLIENILSNGLGIGNTAPVNSGIHLYAFYANNAIIDSNTISNLNAINTGFSDGGTMVIAINCGITNTSATRNRIYGLSNASISSNTTEPPTIAGIFLRNTNSNTPVLVANNMISLGNGLITNTAIIGLWDGIGSSTTFTPRIYYNSINIEGKTTYGSQPSMCFYRGNFSDNTTIGPVDLKNNIFTNKRSGGTGKHYSIANGYPASTSSSSGWNANTSNFNVLNANSSTIGYWSGDKTFGGWKATSAGDINSLSSITVNYINNATDLHLQAESNAAIDGKGLPISDISNDIDNEIRNSTSPDIGADEFGSGLLAISVEYFKGNRVDNDNVLSWKASCSLTPMDFLVERSYDGRNYTVIGSITASQARCGQPFNFKDHEPKSGTNYYRLNIKESDGNDFYSTVITIINKKDAIQITRFIPANSRTKNTQLEINLEKDEKINFVITDISGRIVQKFTKALWAGVNKLNFNIPNLSIGKFQLTIYNSDGVVKSISFIIF